MTQADAYSNSKTVGTGGHDHSHDHDEPHVLPLTTYFAVWGALVVLTVLTVTVSRFDFGAANTVIAMFVATVKATLVALFFMHLFYDNKLNLIILVASLMFVSIFFTPVLIDLSSRGALDSLKTRAGYKSVMVVPVEPVADPVPAAEAPAAGAPAGAGAAAGTAAPAGAAAPADHAAAVPAAPPMAPAAGDAAAGTSSISGAGQIGNKAAAAGAPVGGLPTAAPTGHGVPSPAKNQPDPGPGQPSVTQPANAQPAGAHP